jgi:uncharacterized protein YlxW (UPF0749 family)
MDEPEKHEPEKHEPLAASRPDWPRWLRSGAGLFRLRLRITKAHLLAGLLLGLLGFSLVVQARQTQAGNLTTLSQSELVRLLDEVTNKADRLDVDARRLQQTSEDLRTGSDRAAAAEKAARSRLEVLGILAGTEPAEGPGISLRIEDPHTQVDAAELLDTVEELRDAGAEAIQLGDVRVVASTSFVDATGGGVRVDGVAQTAPFTFLAIGDSQTLESALDIPGGVLDTLHQGGASGTVRREPELTVSAVHELSPLKYAVPNSGN